MSNPLHSSIGVEGDESRLWVGGLVTIRARPLGCLVTLSSRIKGRLLDN